jgi:NAD(P)-dependent dehydrogenase (short-subunit alcohol dehydrogenase family)
LLEDVPADKLAWYEDMMRVNLWGSVYCTHAALPALKESHGRIVAVSSLAGMVGVPGRTAYCASKFAMAGFFEALRAEVKDAGVSVTIAYPGVVRTNIRHHGFNAQGEIAGVSGLHEDKAMSTQDCARQIIYGMVRRRREVVMTAPGDHRVWQQLKATVKAAGLSLEVCEDRHFFTTVGDFAAHAKGRKTLRLEYFYRELRQRFGILMDGKQPAGGQWNFDTDNRESFGPQGPGALPARATF